MAITRQKPISSLLAESNKVMFSVEFMPPRDDAAEARLWKAAGAFKDLGASFVSVTYGAGGSTRDRTFRIAERLAALPLTTLVHLTLVEHSRAELLEILETYAQAGLTNLLALRGDPPGDPLGEWIKATDGLEFTSELIELVQTTEASRHFDIGIAAFPEGHHRADTLDIDTEVTLTKLRDGAEYAITQVFFDVEHFLRLRDRLVAADPEHGAKPIIPGIMPITSLRSVHRQIELSGATMAPEVGARLEKAALSGDAAVRAEGIQISSEMTQRLIDEGVPDVHFMTMNFAKATHEVLHNVGMAPAWEKS
ncbi:methylenetetrahydrofolate reductase [Corynebacterium hindlerae]|uniref:Methylenetetrahydrofolate reductase n=1 Tax=Corynebacterium hindlerae TaxID=699041 RepID=A0A7G5FEG7_9CORY|nr:methylenetetrahydrofolate reductase [Corynebacterium hindlerae]QMV85008.1 methylenetetrahydrofolate reductase [Corynebacterium hindlerae]